MAVLTTAQTLLDPTTVTAQVATHYPQIYTLVKVLLVYYKSYDCIALSFAP